MKHLQINENGVTLIEILLALAITAVVISGLMSVYWLQVKSFSLETTLSEVQYTARQVRRIMLEDINRSENIQVLDSFNGSEVTPGDKGTCLKLIVSFEDEIGTKYLLVYYYLENNRLYRQRCTLADRNNYEDTQFLDKIPVADNMNLISFESPMPGLINYELVSRYNDEIFCLWGSSISRIDYGLNGI